jgi:hypothetical protein
MSEEEEKKLARLEKRLVTNVDFDDQTLNLLGFSTNIYYMLEHLGWMQFSNGVSANTHKEFALEILMTMAPILNEGVPSLSFRLEGIQQVVPYEHIRELLFLNRELRKSRCAGRHVGWFLEYDLGRSPPTKKFYPEPQHPSVSLMDVQKDFGENEGNKGDRHGVELALLGFDCQAANRPLLPHDLPVVL